MGEYCLVDYCCRIMLFILNHGGAVIHGEITDGRRLAAILTYLMPYTVSIHG